MGWLAFLDRRVEPQGDYELRHHGNWIHGERSQETRAARAEWEAWHAWRLALIDAGITEAAGWMRSPAGCHRRPWPNVLLTRRFAGQAGHDPRIPTLALNHPVDLNPLIEIKRVVAVSPITPRRRVVRERPAQLDGRSTPSTRSTSV